MVRPASAEESFEIVRRRLFEPLVEREQFVARDTVARAFYDLYRTQHQEFPPECRDSDYEQRLKAQLEPAHNGEFIAIEPDSGDYYLGRHMEDATTAFRAAHPDLRIVSPPSLLRELRPASGRRC